MDSFKGDDKFLPWIKQIAANTARDWLKKKKPMLFTDLNDDDDMAFEEQIEDEREENIPEKLIEQKETIRLIGEIVDSLPDDQRAVIGMYYYEKKSVKDIASAMGASQSAIKSRLKYGRDKIKAKVAELESKGTNLYGLAPFTFWLLLIHNMKGFTTELIPDANILHNVIESIDGISHNPTKTGHIGKGNVKAPGVGAAVATGGMGDVLSGITAAMICHDGIDSLAVAACAAVYLHGAAGDYCARHIGPYGFTATEVASAVPKVLAQWDEARPMPALQEPYIMS